MKNKIKILFVLVVVFKLSVSTVYANWVNIQITTAIYGYEVSWDLTDSNGTILAFGPLSGGYLNNTTYNHYVYLVDDCYNMNMYDSYGDGWNGGTYNILDSASGVVSYANGGLAYGSTGTDVVCIGPFGCTNPLAINYDSTALVDNDSCIFSTCTNVTLYMQDSYGNGWGGSLWTITGVVGGNFGSFTLLSGPASQVSFCLPDDCYDITVTLNQYPGDISWQLVEDTTGNILAEGCNSTNPCAFLGCPYNGPNLCFPVIWGCTDPFASNFDSLATLNDGSCLYPGCLDSIAINYCSACNVNDSLSCIYPSCHSLDFCEGFETANLLTNDWVVTSAVYSSVSLTTSNALVDTVSLEFTGGNVFYAAQLTESAAFSDPDHLSRATICVDLSGSSAIVDMGFEAEISSVFSNCAWFRVKVNGAVVADKNGVTAFNDQTVSGLNTYAYDLSAYTGQSSVYVTFEAMCNYNLAYGSPSYVWIDNVCVFDVNQCTYYSASATITDVACNGDSTGVVSVIVSSGYGADSYAWSNGQTLATATGLSAGAYTCIVSDSANGCSDSIFVTVTEPTAISISGIVVHESSPGVNDGSINVTVSGGTPCSTDIYLGTSTNVSGSYSQSAALFYTQYKTNKSELTFQASELSALGLQIGQSLSSVGWNIATASGQAMNNLNLALSEGGITTNVYSGNYTAVVGWNDFTFSNPVIWNGGDIVVTTCFINSFYTTYNTWYYTTTPFVSCSYLYQGSASGSICANPTTSTTSNRPNTRFGTNGLAYAFLWASGDTTENISGLTVGPQSVTVTDCNGCTETNAWFVMVNTVPGCTDSSATNYNPLANVNDSSCLYLGCTDSLALNFDSTANLNDSSCVYLCNYYGLNTVVVVINSGNWANDISWDITNSNGLILGSGSGYYTNYTDSVGVDTICLADGCYNFNMYDSYGNGWTGGNYVIYVNSVSIATGGLLSGSFGTDQFQVGTSIPCPIFGCTDSLASNYSVLATVDDSSCVYCVGTTLTLEMYDSYGDGWNGAFFVLQGLASSSVAISTTLTGGYYGSETFNCIPDGCYNLTVSSGTYPYEVSWHLLDANGDTTLTGGAPFNGGLNLNSSCVIGCMDSLALNYDSTAVLPGSCIFPIYGCTDSSAYNYDSTAVIDDGSCVYAPATMASLYFSEYAEGSSNNKYFEVYNASNDTVYLANYAYPNVGNSPTTPGVYEYWNDFDVGAVVAPGDVYIVAHPSADPIILAEADEIHTYLSNGDDGYALVYGSNPGSPMSPAAGGYIVMDWLGDWNGDPGSGWSVAGVSNGTKDHTLVRKCSVAHGNTNWALSAGTSATSSEWEVFPQNYWTNIGQHITPCLVNIYGCTDSTALNYNPFATIDDSSCLYGIFGCTDSLALNYDSTATIDDGSCIYAPAAMVNLYFSEYAEGSSNNKYFEIYNASNDTVDLSAYAYPSVGNAPTTPGVYEYWNDFDVGAVVAPGDVYIVAHPSADPIILAEADEYHYYLSNGDDGYALVYGSNPGSPMNPAAGGYIVMDWLGDWNGDPGSGWSVAGVSNGTKDHTLVRKCSVTHGNTNWVLSAGTSATSSEWEVFPQNDWTNIGQHITPCLVSIYGCTDSTALNYSPLATVDDSSCVYCVYGCVDSTALNYDPLATCNDGSCTYCVYGCMDTTQFNYSPLATCDDGSCIPIIYGCTDSTAINYYAAANTNNGTCVYCTYGCMDPIAINYNSAATCDDGSCTYPASCNSPSPTGLNVTDLTHDRAKINWADANTSLCMVEMYRVQYRELGTTAWNTKTAIGSGLCNFGLLTTSKMLWNLTPSTVYEYRAKAWYCSASASTWSSISTFTTLDLCPNILNFAVSSGSNTQATFSWTAPSTPYSFVRIKLRVDTTGSTWLTAGGYGVMYPALTRNKNGLTAGQSYRASSRTWCNPSGGAHKALTWSPFIYWTQPGTLIRIENENSSIENLTIYPNPSRDVFNIRFVSEEKQNLEVRLVNLIGEQLIAEDLKRFIGEYAKEIDLTNKAKGIYFLEIETDDGVINKKLILQ